MYLIRQLSFLNLSQLFSSCSKGEVSHTTWAVMVKQRGLDAQIVGGLSGLVWESPEVTVLGRRRFACLL
jgi:hypothetical protein